MHHRRDRPSPPQLVPEPTDRSRLSRWVPAWAAAVLIVAWASVAAVLHLKWQDDVNGEFQQNTNLARALEEQALRVFASADQAMVRVRDAVAAGGGTAAKFDLVHVASETGLVPNILVQLSLVDAGGRFVASNLDPDGKKVGPVDLSSRDHVRVHLAPQGLAPADRPNTPADLYVGKAVLGKVSGKWTIQLSRRLVSTQGATLGVVVASLDPAYFEQVFRGVSLGRLGGVILLGRDGGIRARVIGGSGTGMGSLIKPADPLAPRMLDAEGATSGVSSIDGVMRFAAYRRVTGYPLYVVVATAESEALAGWRATRNGMVVLTLLLSGAVAAGAFVFLGGVRRLESSNAALRASEAQARSANQAKTEFLAAISHELRTPLTSIRGFAELMEHRLEQPMFREQAGLIRKGAEHLNELLGEILDLAKVEAGAMQLTVETVDLRALVQGTGDFFALVAADKGLKLAVVLAPELPPLLRCDGLRLKQILNNLVSNAVRFTPLGSVSVSAGLRAGRVVVDVADTGPGIPQRMQELIFEKFRQGDSRVSHEHGGTGLGLALARALAELMEGTLVVDSTLGEGSRFTLSLPLRPASVAVSNPPQPVAATTEPA